MKDQTLDQVIVRSLQEGVLTIECNGVISGANPAALRILNLTCEEIVGHTIGRVGLDTVPNREFLEVFQSLVTNGIVTPHRELEFTAHDGRKIQLSISSAALDVTECVPGMESYVVLFRDITAFKNLETAKRKAADHLSHELKTPLAIVKASLERLLEFSESNPKASNLIKRTERNLDRLLSIQDSVEQIFSPPKPHPEQLLVQNYTNKIIAEILQRAQHRDIVPKIEFQYTGSIFFDPGMLKQILTTLIKNAFENTPDQGLVKVIFCEPSSGRFEISVHDYGVGITLKDSKFIFEGFHHTQDTNEYSTKKPYDFNAGGKGLELFQLKSLLEFHGFEFVFQSKRCLYIPESTDHCPGKIDICPHIKNPQECLDSGYSVFKVMFTDMRT